MTNLVPIAVADFETQLASAISAGATSFTLASATDDDGNTLTAGKYCFTINNGSSNKQYLIGQVNGTAVTSVVTVSRQGVESSGAQYAARAGAPVIISDFATIQRVADALRGQIDLDGDNPITYDAEPSLSNREELATVGYVLDQVNGGTVDFDNQIISSSDATAGETISAGNLVFFQTSDQEWYQADADTAAEVNGVQLGIALGSGTDGVSITGGVQISGVYTTTGLTAGDTYYASNTAGAITNSAGTTNRVIGVALSTTKLLLIPTNPQSPTSDEKAALAGAGAAPSSSNKYLTAGDIDDNSIFVPPTVNVYTSSDTWTKDAGLKYVVVEVVGGGGGGQGVNGSGSGDCGAGGGGGGYSRKLIAASALGSTETVTVGAAGAGTYGAETAGGTSSFGAHCSATGGSPGGGSAGGAGGAGASGDVNAEGQGGMSSDSGNGNSGSGGSSVLGGGGKGGDTETTGDSGGAYGGGGAGAVDLGAGSDVNGGAGAAGVVIVTEYYS